MLARHRQQGTLRQGDLFTQTTIADYLFDKDKIYAYLNLDDNELFIYQRLYDLLVRDAPTPDLVVYLQAPTDVVWRRLKRRHRQSADATLPDERDVQELNDAVNHFFFHYSAAALLVVETSELDLSWSDETLDELLRQIHGTTAGTRYYVPRTGSSG